MSEQENKGGEVKPPFKDGYLFPKNAIINIGIGKTGLVLDKGNVDALEQAVKDILCPHDQSLPMGVMGKISSAISEFSEANNKEVLFIGKRKNKQNPTEQQNKGQTCDAVFEFVIKITMWMPILALSAGWSWRLFLYAAGY